MLPRLGPTFAKNWGSSLKNSIRLQQPRDDERLKSVRLLEVLQLPTPEDKSQSSCSKLVRHACFRRRRAPEFCGFQDLREGESDNVILLRFLISSRRAIGQLLHCEQNASVPRTLCLFHLNMAIPHIAVKGSPPRRDALELKNERTGYASTM